MPARRARVMSEPAKRVPKWLTIDVMVLVAFEIALAIAIVLAALPFAYWGLLAWRLLYD
jgi:hypothetical protein